MRVGWALALPFLEYFSPARALAQDAGGPKRILVFIHQQGTVLNQWVPSGSEFSFTLPTILAPLDPWKDRCTFIAGLDNPYYYQNAGGDGHTGAANPLLTCELDADPYADRPFAGGPSLEQILSERIGGGTPYSRIDLATGTGWDDTHTSGIIMAGSNDPIAARTNPEQVFNSLFAGLDDNSAADALRERRVGVLDAVLENFNQLRARVGADDRDRLDAHAEKIIELEQRIADTGPIECSPPDLSLPSGYDHNNEEYEPDTSATMIDLLTMALACDMTKVGTFQFARSHGPEFPFLWDEYGGPLVDYSVWDNWHHMIHDGRDEPALVAGFTWYTTQFALLLERMAAMTDIDGDNLLDTTMVLWISDFGNGAGHNTIKLPVVMAGNTGGGQMGRFLDFMNGGPDDNWSASDYSTNMLYTAILQAFGGSDTTFGHQASYVPQGVLPGLVLGRMS